MTITLADYTITFLILYCFVFGIWTALKAKKKKRNKFAWFFIGLIFGVFGLIGVLLVDKKEFKHK